MSKKRKKKKKKKEHLDDLGEPADEDQFEEKALQEEVIPLRRLIVRGDTTEMTQMPMDLKRAVNEAAELKSEIDEYEETVAEKDRLIKKLYENVDSLVDTEQDLELKLQHAEEECVKLKRTFPFVKLLTLLASTSFCTYFYISQLYRRNERDGR